MRKSFIKGAGYGDDALERIVIGIADTSDFNPCHGNSEDLVEHVRAGVLAAGLPMAFPTISLHESFAYPTSVSAKSDGDGHRRNAEFSASGCSSPCWRL